MTSRPVAFLSSTIYDLRDIRSAVRFLLEEAGVEVWMSEYNDMVKPAGANAFEACFESIRQADFYILFIGEKKGSTYSTATGASVTQQEYREAYASFEARGRPIPVLFVRAEVRDRIDGWVRGGRGGNPPFPDAPFVASFIEEVERQNATVGAIAGIGPYPLANWLERFHDFKGVVDSLKVALGLRVDVSMQRVFAAMRLDLEPTLAAFIRKDYYKPKGTSVEARLREVTDTLPEPERTAKNAELDQRLEEMELKVPIPHHRFFDLLAQECSLPKSSARDEVPVPLNAEQATLLRRHLFVGIPSPDSIRIRSIQDAVAAGSLLAYNPVTRQLEETPLSLAAEELTEQARHYQWAFGMVERHRWELFEALKGRRGYALPYIQAVDIWSLHHAQTNFYRRAAAIYAYLIGRKQDPLPEELLPHSPFGAETDEQIKRERTDRADVREWSDMQEFWKL